MLGFDIFLESMYPSLLHLLSKYSPPCLALCEQEVLGMFLI